MASIRPPFQDQPEQRFLWLGTRGLGALPNAKFQEWSAGPGQTIVPDFLQADLGENDRHSLNQRRGFPSEPDRILDTTSPRQRTGTSPLLRCWEQRQCLLWGM